MLLLGVEWLSSSLWWRAWTCITPVSHSPKEKKNVRKDTGQDWTRNPSLCCYLELFPEWFHYWPCCAELKEKDILKLFLKKKKKKKACSDNEGFHGISVFYFLLELSGVVLEFFGSNCCLPSPALVVPVCDQPHTGAELAGARHSVLRARGVLRPRASSPCSAFWQAVCPYFER